MKDRFVQNSVTLTGLKPNILSSEKIFPPIHSAISALATKNAEIPRNNFAGLFFNYTVDHPGKKYTIKKNEPKLK
jgi:hypothetical protein